MADELAQGKCVPCEGGTPQLAKQEREELLAQVPGWDVEDDKRIRRSWKFEDFAQALAFVNRVGAVAEQEQHHPDIHFGWGHAEVVFTTHAIGGLSRNDFILAAKINQLAS